ncbi:MAG: VWA domain-containing protein [Pseudomonadota bacterium]
MMRFADSTYLFLLLILPALAFFLAWAWGKRRIAWQRFAEAALAERLADEVVLSRLKLKEVLVALVVLLMLLALARPQWGFRWEDVKRRGVDIMIVVDVSKSMHAADASPSRLVVAKRKIEDFLNILEGDRVGLVAFSGRAFVMTPLTLDYGAIRLFTNQIETGLVPSPGTSLADAIDISIKALSKGKPESRAILLISDGEDLGGDVDGAIARAKEFGVKIYTLGVGTPDGAPIPSPGGGFMKDGGGAMVLSKLDEATLSRISSETGALSFGATANDSDITKIYRDIRGGLNEMELKGGRQKHFIDRFEWLLFAALAMLMAEALMSAKKGRRRWPKLPWVAMIALLFISGEAMAFGVTGKAREGERFYNEGKYAEALESFLSAQVDDPNDLRLSYNIANSCYKLGKFDEAAKMYSGMSEKLKGALKERSVYNLGNSFFKGLKLEDAVKSYEDALKLDPKDADAKYNLELAKKALELKKQQQQKGDGQDQQKKEDEKNKEGEKKESQGKAGDEKMNAEAAGRDDGKKAEARAGEMKEEGTMTKEEANRFLSAVREGKIRINADDKRGLGKHPGKGEW